MSLSITLKEYLFYSNLTVKEFSEIVQISRGYMSSIVNGSKKPSKKIIDKIKCAIRKRKTPLVRGVNDIEVIVK